MKFPTNPINALEASHTLIKGGGWEIMFPTNPINALEASHTLIKGGGWEIMFPTNPINALEASNLEREELARDNRGFQLIQLTHWKRVWAIQLNFGWTFGFQLIQLTHWKRAMEYSPSGLT